MIAAAVGGFSAYQYHLQEQRRLEFQAARKGDAIELAKCTSSTLSSAGLRDLVFHGYRLGGFDFKDAAKFFAEKGVGNIKPQEMDFSEVTRRADGFDWSSFDTIIKRCKPKYGPPFDEAYRWTFWEALEKQAEFSAMLQKVKAENEEILAPYRRIKDEQKKAAAVERQKREAALFKNPY